jgi:hypothetical protein
VNRLHKISPSDSILLLILLVLLSFSLLPLLFGNCGKTWLALQIGFAAASARLEMSRAEAMHNIASSLALPSPLAVPLPLSMLLSFSLSLDMLRKRSEGLVDGRDERGKRRATARRVAFWDTSQQKDKKRRPGVWTNPTTKYI